VLTNTATSTEKLKNGFQGRAQAEPAWSIDRGQRAK